MATRNKDEFPSFLCSQGRAYEYVVDIGMRVKARYATSGM